MKSLYESILDDDIMDKADKKVELVGRFRNMLSKGMSREYSAANVKKLANEFVKKHDILPHTDEWPEIVKWLNTYLGTKFVQEPPIEYKMSIYSQPGKRNQNAEYQVVLNAYWRTFYIKDGERKITQTVSGSTSILKFNHAIIDDWKEKSEKYSIEVCAVSDTKWAKRLARELDRKPQFDDKNHCYFAL